ncbi:hypothetical protein [Variovorax sp. PBL-E5]|uniref:hypothetical protein n=1 Tax=Variovorax sp. PBL-E5 TaxID=434014 RepID=UPI001318412F|nr:hypothetical protein [Variovorax sp. PBL-E5]VTU37133.1 hypothetical protein E5CHR_04494 [Variovorax sp. PBL-E5]
MAEFIAFLLTGRRAGFHVGPQGWARFRRGHLVDASPAVWNAYKLRAAHLDQVGY